MRKTTSVKTYRPMIKNGLIELIDNNPQLSFTEILYTIFRDSNFPDKPMDVNTGWMIMNDDKLTDKNFYTAINRAITELNHEKTTEK